MRGYELAKVDCVSIICTWHDFPHIGYVNYLVDVASRWHDKLHAFTKQLAGRAPHMYKFVYRL